MNKNLILYLTFIGLIGLLSNCEKDETKAVLTNPVAPTITTLPDLTLQRAHALDTIVFVGTAVDPGSFRLSANYFLEACVTGNNFRDSVLLFSGIQDTLMKFTVTALNGILLTKFPADAVSSVDFRIRSVLARDAGTGAVPMIYISDKKTANVTIYGLPRLDLIGSGITQKIESALGNGSYTGFVKLTTANPFTLKNPDANIVYGNNAGALAVNGAVISVSADGWYKLTVNTGALTYSNNAYNVGLIGSGTPNGWNTPDTKMNYDAQTGSWFVAANLTNGLVMKFRLNDAWDQGLNIGYGNAANPQYNSLSNLWNDGNAIDIPITIATGNYIVRLYLGTPIRCTLTSN